MAGVGGLRVPGRAGIPLVVASVLLALLPGTTARAAGLQDRISGPDREGTAIALSQSAFASAPAAVLAVSSAPADALSAAPLAVAVGGPVLLNPTALLRADVAAEIERLGATTLYLMGGTAALSADVEDDLAARFPSADIVRLAGADRYETAALAADVVVSIWGVQRVLVALGDHPVPSRAWPDALGAGVLAGYAQRPILLVAPDRVPTATQAWVDGNEPSGVTVIGGTAAISAEIASSLGADERLGGTDRYDTARLVAEAASAHGADLDDLLLATGRNFPDGLAAGPAAVATGRGLLLVDGADLDGSPATRRFLDARSGSITGLTMVGGSAAVSRGTAMQAYTEVVGIDGLSLQTETIHSGGDTYMALGWVGTTMYAAERDGRLYRIDPGGGRTLALDIRNRVRTNGERGFLGFAFHPQDAGRLFVHYSRASDGATVLSEFTGAAEEVLVVQSQPASNHNGGDLHFGPDGLLYLALGDGGGSNDQYGHGQDTASRLGAVLRYDVSTPGVARPATGNPFIGTGGNDAIWAYGLRNPYRGLAWDTITGTLWLADVGQGDYEEVNAVPASAAGVNYGWSIREGAHCFRSASCTTTGLTDPVFEYATHVDGTCSVIGGAVLRGNDDVAPAGRYTLAALHGHYFFSDFCERTLRSFALRDGTVVELRDWLSLSGNPYAIAVHDGAVYVSTGDADHRVAVAP